ncbi:SDR family oxidoreductase [Phytomonospora sp. NPDC050363]|uniref:SDR family oxidoreductase n=1 Tax=Phytomonospora sp. NPDC050363 TaxID=3155642 RepID=UPI0033E65637
MTDKIALITGANKGIGLEIARGLGKAGVTVLVGARSPERGEAAVGTLRAEGHKAEFVRIDVTDAETIAAAAQVVEEVHGRLDILVNNAAVLNRQEGWVVTETPVAAVRDTYETNVFGVIAVTNAFVPLLERSAEPRIVNVSSEVGSFEMMTNPDSPYYMLKGVGYQASKAALNAVTIAYSKHFAGTAFKVNAVNPGYCATDLNGHAGHRTPEQGSRAAIRMALIGADGPTGTFESEEGPHPW